MCLLRFGVSREGGCSARRRGAFFWGWDCQGKHEFVEGGVFFAFLGLWYEKMMQYETVVVFFYLRYTPEYMKVNHDLRCECCIKIFRFCGG